MSGVLALVVLGVYYGCVGRTNISPDIEEFLHEFWEMLAYIVPPAPSSLFPVPPLLFSVWRNRRPVTCVWGEQRAVDPPLSEDVRRASYPVFGV